jgi:hypothetical protein
LAPAFAQAAPSSTRSTVSQVTATAASIPLAKNFIVRRIGLAVALAAFGLLIVASIPAVAAYASGIWSSPSAPVMHGPSTSLRAAAGVGGNWERSIASAAPPIEQLGSLSIAGAMEREHQALVNALDTLAAEQRARASAASSTRGSPFTRNAASGYAVGTVLTARITVYGCVGPGGGFCGGMAGGGRVFEGAAACSYDLPFGTKIKIHGDPTGRVYECLDRGHLAATWVDVFFHNTSDGIRWQSLLGGTRVSIEIVN